MVDRTMSEPRPSTASNPETKSDMKSESKRGGSTKGLENWVLITRAHFTEILCYLALQEGMGPTVRKCYFVCAFFY